MLNKLKNFISVKVVLFKDSWPLMKAEIKIWVWKFLRIRWKKFKRVFQKPKKFLKWVFYVIVMIKTKATPKNILKFIKWCVVRLGSFCKSSYIILLSQNWNHHDVKFYLIVNCTIFLLLKIYQEIRFNFSCPVATLLYGKFVRKERPKKTELDERRKRPKLHKFVQDPFHNKEERKRKIAEKEKKIADRAVIETKLINERLVWFCKMYRKNAPFYVNLKKKHTPALKKYRREFLKAMRNKENSSC